MSSRSAVTILDEHLEVLPIHSKEREEAARTLRDFGHRFDTQRVLELAARYADRPAKWYMFGRATARLAKAGVIPRDPLKGIPGPRMQPREGKIITSEEFERLREASKTSAIHYVLLAMHMTGLSIGDACLLQWSEVDLETGMIDKIRKKMKTRSGGRCIIPLDPNGPFMELLRARFPSKDEYVGHYPSVNGAHYVDQWSAQLYLRGSRGMQDMTVQFKAVCRTAGVDGIRFHDFRRTTATRMLQKLDPITVSQITGHKTLAALSRYIIPDKDNLRKAVLERVHGAI